MKVTRVVGMWPAGAEGVWVRPFPLRSRLIDHQLRVELTRHDTGQARPEEVHTKSIGVYFSRIPLGDQRGMSSTFFSISPVSSLPVFPRPKALPGLCCHTEP